MKSAACRCNGSGVVASSDGEALDCPNCDGPESPAAPNQRFPNASQDAVFPAETPKGDATGPAPGVAAVSAAAHIPPWVTMLTPPNPHSKSGARTIVLAERGYRSKWTKLVCFCKHERKRDGLCKTLDQLVPLLAHPDRVRFEHDHR